MPFLIINFSAPCEWFAEAFAAYYNPVEGAESRLRLDPEVRAYFFNKVGPFHGKKMGVLIVQGEFKR